MSVVFKCDGCGRLSDPPYALVEDDEITPLNWDYARDDERFDWCPWCQVRYGVRKEADFPALKFPPPLQIVALNVDPDVHEEARALLGLNKKRKGN
jgi:hypothetical protein